MHRHKFDNIILLPILFFILALSVSFIAEITIKNLDAHHLLLLLMMVFPLFGTASAIFAIIKATGYWKLVPFLFLLANIAWSVWVFLGFSVSYLGS